MLLSILFAVLALLDKVPKMFFDILRSAMLNVIVVELAINIFRHYDIFLNSSFKSPRGQHAIATTIIGFLALLAVHFTWKWLLVVYAIYLSIGLVAWIYRRVYFYHRRLDSLSVNQAINHFDSIRQFPGNGDHGTGTLKHSNKNNGGTHSSASSNGDGYSTNGAEQHTNSLQRQRALAYKEFRLVLNEPRYNPREFALSLAHLSNISRLAVFDEVFDEMHFQILATRRDVANIILRFALLSSAVFITNVY